MSITSNDYLVLLQNWVKPALRNIYQPADNHEIACYGPGNHGHWAQQTNTTAFAAFAVLAADPNYDQSVTGVSSEELLKYALKMMRFSLRSHLAGPDVTLDGGKWGNFWISPLCLERMMHGVEAIENHLTDADWSLLRAVLESECAYLTDKYEVTGAIDGNTGKNHPEVNIWCGAILHRTVMMFPDTPRAAEFKARGTKYLINGISIPSDATDQAIYAGKPVSQWHVGPNFTENFGLNHHSYLNVGYMVICLSNIAMLHFSYKKRNLQPPAELYHHVLELWRLIKFCTFSDGRLWRVGGDTRVRYCYCQDYAIPMWLMVQDKFGDTDTARFEEGWLKLVAKEQGHNGDGSFMAERLEELEEVSPLYFTRLEGDKAVTLSMGVYWRRIYQEFSGSKYQRDGEINQWADDFHGAMAVHGKRRNASFVWQSAQKPMAQCVPHHDSSLAEWRWNMIGEIAGTSCYNIAEVLDNNDCSFPGGFNTCGKIRWWSKNHASEGQANEITAEECVAFAALPDDATVVAIQRAETIFRTHLARVKGLFFNVPNDIFNGKVRDYSIGERNFSLKGCTGKKELIRTASRSIVIDNKVRIDLIAGENELQINRPAKRQVTLFSAHQSTDGRSGGNLYCDEICAPCVIVRKDYPARTILFDISFSVSVTPELKTKSRSLSTSEGDFKAVLVSGADGKKYIFVATFGAGGTAHISGSDCKKVVTIKGDFVEVNDGIIKLALGAMDSVLLRVIE